MVRSELEKLILKVLADTNKPVRSRDIWNVLVAKFDGQSIKFASVGTVLAYMHQDGTVRKYKTILGPMVNMGSRNFPKATTSLWTLPSFPMARAKEYARVTRITGETPQAVWIDAPHTGDMVQMLDDIDGVKA